MFDLRFDARGNIGPVAEALPAEVAKAVADEAKSAHALLLANHGPVVSAKDLTSAVYIAEELEEAARIFLLTRGHAVRPLTAGQVETLKIRFPA